MWIPIALAAAGMAKSQLVDKPKEDAARTLAAKTQALSPWTGLEAQPFKKADPFGTAAQAGGAGLGIMSNLGEQNMKKQWLEAQKNNPWAGQQYQAMQQPAANSNMFTGGFNPNQA